MQKPTNTYIYKVFFGRKFQNSEKLGPKSKFSSGLPPDQKSPFLKCYLRENNFVQDIKPWSHQVLKNINLPDRHLLCKLHAMNKAANFFWQELQIPCFYKLRWQTAYFTNTLGQQKTVRFPQQNHSFDERSETVKLSQWCLPPGFGPCIQADETPGGGAPRGKVIDFSF